MMLARRTMNKYLAKFERKGSLFWIGMGCLGIAIVGAADFLSGNEVAFSIFYLIPILGVTWFTGRTLGYAISVVAAATWLGVHMLSEPVYSLPIIPWWNALVRLGFFLIVAALLPALKALEHEKKIARIDPLTGAANRRHFLEVMEMEIDRAQRYHHCFAIAYLDVDNFKTVNDELGHLVGDKLLCTVVNEAKHHLRKTDIVARMGGDEFIFLLHEIDQQTLRTLMTRLQASMLSEMQRNHWPVGFSIGVLTWQDGPTSVNELIRRADDLMYSVKKAGKNSISYGIYSAAHAQKPQARHP